MVRGDAVHGGKVSPRCGFGGLGSRTWGLRPTLQAVAALRLRRQSAGAPSAKAVLDVQAFLTCKRRA